MLLMLDRESKVPFWQQIRDRVAGLVDEGSLSPGTRLPSSRVLASKVGVNRSTVYRAYQELWAQGYLESRPGSYSVIRGRLRPPAPDEAPAGLIDWGEVSSPAARRVHADWAAQPAVTRPAPDSVDFASLAADESLCPLDAFRRSLRWVLAHGGSRLLDYGDPAGYAPLRESIARRLRTHGVSATPDQILITNGAQHALDLALRLLARPGGSVAVEVPTYAAALPLFRLHGVSLSGMPMLPDGPDLDVLEALLERERPALIYTVPNFQNPTGITTGQAHRERLLALAEHHRVPVLEDGFEEEMKYFGKAVLPIKSMDARGIVLYVGTFSKVVFSGLRIGWIAADQDCIRRLLAVTRYSNLSGNTLVQAAFERFCATGAYEHHLRRMHRIYRRRMEALLGGLERHVPAEAARWTRPLGGYTLWLRLANGFAGDENDLYERLIREGVRVAPGHLFFPERPDGTGMRLSIAKAREETIEQGCRRLGRVLSRMRGG